MVWNSQWKVLMRVITWGHRFSFIRIAISLFALSVFDLKYFAAKRVLNLFPLCFIQKMLLKAPLDI
jgi:hypothetical protein